MWEEGPDCLCVLLQQDAGTSQPLLFLKFPLTTGKSEGNLGGHLYFELQPNGILVTCDQCELPN